MTAPGSGAADFRGGSGVGRIRFVIDRGRGIRPGRRRDDGSPAE
jgi:hypothetical protein